MRRQTVVATGVIWILVGGCTSGSPRSHLAGQVAGHRTVAPMRTASPGKPDAARHPAQQPGKVTAEVASWAMPEPLAREVVVRTGTGAVVAGGLIAGDSSTSRAFRVDVRTGHRFALPALPVPVHDAAGADPAGTVLVVGGGNTTEQSTVQRLGGHGRWRVIGRMPGARSDLVTATVGQRVLVMGGYDGTVSPVDILVSSSGRSFRTIGRLAVAVRYPAVAVADGAVWLFGGERNGHQTDVVQRVDPRSGLCRVAGRLPQPLGHSAAAVIGGRVLLAGGRARSDRPTAAMWWYDPSTSTFRRAGHLPYPLADTGVTTSGGVTYLIGGETPALTSRVIRIIGG